MLLPLPVSTTPPADRQQICLKLVAVMDYYSNPAADPNNPNLGANFMKNLLSHPPHSPEEVDEREEGQEERFDFLEVLLDLGKTTALNFNEGRLTNLISYSVLKRSLEKYVDIEFRTRKDTTVQSILDELLPTFCGHGVFLYQREEFFKIIDKLNGLTGTLNLGIGHPNSLHYDHAAYESIIDEMMDKAAHDLETLLLSKEIVKRSLVKFGPFRRGIHHFNADNFDVFFQPVNNPVFELYRKRDQLASRYKLKIDESEEVENEKEKQRLHSRWMKEEAEIQKKLEGHLGPLVMNLVAKGPHCKISSPIPTNRYSSSRVPGNSTWVHEEWWKGEQKLGGETCRPPRSNDP